MSIFDPLEPVSNFTVKAKILLRHVWASGIGWDDQLTQNQAEKWNFWISELKGLSVVQVPRCYSLLIPNAESIDLHVFCDASEQAFAAVAFLRILKGSKVELGFVGSKTRVAPVRQISIPRLELQAAVLGSRMAKAIQDEHEIKISTTHFWTDSSTVLSWLRSEGRTFKTFVAHRIGEIEELTNLMKWHWVPTKLNIADDATRDVSPTDLGPESRWFNGPEFLRLPESEWPKEKESTRKSTEAAEEEMKGEIVLITTPYEPIIDLNRFSTYNKLLRTVGWIMRFVNNCRGRKSTDELSVYELQKAEKELIKISQAVSFQEEIRSLKSGKVLDRSSPLYQLSPLLDSEGVVRVNGRIRESDVNDAVKFPIILKPKNQVTKLLIMHFHKKANHQGQEFVLNELRQQYWIIQGRAAVRKAWDSCQVCKNHRAKPVLPEMGSLPKFRVTAFVRPFTHTGVDYFGPLEVSVGRRKEKRYGVLFTCLTTRAIHLELAGSLTADACIMAIVRMTCRRGFPSDIYSDNGTNFRGADKELQNSIKELDQDSIKSKLGVKGINWHFNPPGAPHMGGCWERLIQSVKIALNLTLKERAPKEEVLFTFMLEAENLVNSRPLTHVSVDPKDPESLTPNHFMIGTSSPAQPLGVFSEDDFCLRKN